MTETPEQKAEREAAEKAEKAAAAAAEKAANKVQPPKRYGAYNVSLGKYVGGVRDTKKEADDIAKGIKAAGYEADVREV